MAKKQKFYAVRKGRKKGIFTSWADCQKSIKGVSGPVYKSFPTREEAEEYLEQGKETPAPPDSLIAYTDGSWFGRRYGWGAYIVNPACDDAGEEFYGWGDDPELASANNVAGETIAALKAMEYALETGHTDLIIRYDYMGVREWATNAWKAEAPVAVQYVEGVRRFKDQGLNLHFQKIKGHSGNKGNDKADELAARGTSGQTRDIPHRAGYSHTEAQAPSETESASNKLDAKYIIELLNQMLSAASRLDAAFDRDISEAESTTAMLEKIVANDHTLRATLIAAAGLGMDEAIELLGRTGRWKEQAGRQSNVPEISIVPDEDVAQDMAELVESAAARIRRQRQKKKITQSSMASAIGTSAAAISEIERGLLQPDIQTLSAMANYIGCDLPELQGIMELNGGI